MKRVLPVVWLTASMALADVPSALPGRKLVAAGGATIGLSVVSYLLGTVVFSFETKAIGAPLTLPNHTASISIFSVASVVLVLGAVLLGWGVNQNLESDAVLETPFVPEFSRQ